MATARLLRDYQEIQNNPIGTVSAVPLENNLLEWHANLRPSSGLYTGYVIHLIMNFPQEYPTKPPNIKILTKIPHPNIFGDYICLDMLKESAASGPYEGWSTAYTVQSILLQLQSFLFAVNIPQDFGYSVKNINTIGQINSAKEFIKNFSCPICCHSPTNIYPKLICEPENILLPIFPEFIIKKNFMEYYKNCGLNNNICSNYEKKTWGGAIAATKYLVDPSSNNAAYFDINTLEGNGFGRIGWTQNQNNFNIGTDIFSWGYGGTGKKSHKNIFEDYSEGFSIGDNIATILNLKTGEISYLKNKKNLGIAFCVLPGTELYPAISLRDLKIQINFEIPNFVKPEQKNTNLINIFDILNNDVLFVIFEYLNQNHLYSLWRSCKKFQELVEQNAEINKRELMCFHSKKTYLETQLGIGINIIYYANGTIKSITTPLDILSYDCFKEGLRLSVWKEPITHFIPLMINSNYRKKAGPLLMACISNILNKKNIDLTDCLNMISKILNSIIVSLMLEQNNNKMVKQYLSEKALVGYCSFYHVLLSLCYNSNNLVKNIEDTCIKFNSDSEFRTKKFIPDLGIFLIYIGISDIPWKQLVKPIISELFDRNVRWIIEKYPELQFIEPDKISYFRIQKTFECVITSLRLTIFQYYFLTKIARPDKPWNIILEELDRLKGRPTETAKRELHYQSKQIKKINSWTDFFNMIEMEPLSELELTQELKNAVIRSKQKKYHEFLPFKTNGFPVTKKEDSHFI